MGILSAIKSINKKTLYYPGCLLKGPLKEEFENYKSIFNILDIDFILLPETEVCCGLPVLNAGYKKQARKLAKKNYDLFKQNNISKIITSCPSCYHTFKSLYPELLRQWDIEVEHATISILKTLKEKDIDLADEIQENEKEIFTYHDPCHLGRHENIYDEPREVLKILGAKIIEGKYTRENT